MHAVSTSSARARLIEKTPEIGMGEQYSIRLGPGAIARINLERRAAHRYFVHWVYVPPGFRGQGLGDVLLRKVLRDADRAGVSLSLLAKACGHLAQEQLERWYASHGFVPGRLVRLGKELTRSMTRAPRAASSRLRRVA
jgi:GNAT superfamily N-acetyltransferase